MKLNYHFIYILYPTPHIHFQKLLNIPIILLYLWIPIEYTVAHIATSIFDNLLNKIYTMFKFTFGKLTIQLLPPKITWKL